jgi:hypothetical protein
MREAWSRAPRTAEQEALLRTTSNRRNCWPGFGIVHFPACRMQPQEPLGIAIFVNGETSARHFAPHSANSERRLGLAGLDMLLQNIAGAIGEARDEIGEDRRALAQHDGVDRRPVDLIELGERKLLQHGAGAAQLFDRRIGRIARHRRGCGNEPATRLPSPASLSG